MLSLHSTTDAAWLARVQTNLEELLIDHAHCEKKAAGVAMNLIFHYVEHEELCREMTLIVNEELDHFHQVCELIKHRGWKFRRLTPSSYGARLHELERKGEPQRAIDRLLIASLIEARSCERFGVLREGLADRELAEFYGSLFESEARHHSTYVRMAKHYGSDDEVRARLEELAAVEAEIIARGDELVRVHA